MKSQITSAMLLSASLAFEMNTKADVTPLTIGVLSLHNSAAWISDDDSFACNGVGKENGSFELVKCNMGVFEDSVA